MKIIFLLLSLTLIGCTKREYQVRWEKLPVTIYVDKSFPKDQIRSVKEAAEVWNKTLKKEAIKVVETTDSLKRAQDHKNVLTFETDEKFLNQNTQAKTTTYSTYGFFFGTIHEADIAVNAKDFKYSKTATDTSVHMKSLMIHEFGHFLGLMHEEKKESVMYRVLIKGQVRDQMTRLDQTLITNLYNI